MRCHAHPPIFFFFFRVDGEYPGTKPRDAISFSVQVNNFMGWLLVTRLSAPKEALKEWSQVSGSESPGAAGGREQIGKK